MKIIITEAQLHELFPERLYNLYNDPNKEQEVYQDIEFDLNFKNKISVDEYMNLRKGQEEYFTSEESNKLSLLFGDYKKPYQNQYDFKHIRGTFGEPFIKIKGIIYKFKDYYLVNFLYKVSLPHNSGSKYANGVFENFSTLLSFLNDLTTKDIFQDKI